MRSSFVSAFNNRGALFFVLHFSHRRLSDSSAEVDAPISEEGLIKGRQAVERGEVERCVHDQLLDHEKHRYLASIFSRSPPVGSLMTYISLNPHLVLVSLMPSRL